MTGYRKTISFYRDYRGYTGGHQKFCDYLQHVFSLNSFDVEFYLNATSPTHPELFNQFPSSVYRAEYNPSSANIVFLAGMDWNAYLPHYQENQTKVNLIQHVRHADPSEPLFQFLKYKAVRICVSEPVRQAILPYANGPCVTIRMGHALPNLKRPKQCQLYILANKQPELGRRLAMWAKSLGWRVMLHDHVVPLNEVHEAMASAEVTLPLPHRTEGFYLPGIEAMALSDWVVLPDCVASKAYAKSWVNITSCQLTFESCQSALLHAMGRKGTIAGAILRFGGRKMARSFSLERERKALANLLGSLK